MKLVNDWRNWWKWHSTWVFGVLAVFPAVWLASPELQALLPPTWVSAAAPIVAVVGFVVRLRAQAIKVAPPAPPASNDFHQAPTP